MATFLVIYVKGSLEEGYKILLQIPLGMDIYDMKL